MIGKLYYCIRPYACDLCEKKFYRSSTLKTHKKLHADKAKSKDLLKSPSNPKPTVFCYATFRRKIKI